MKRTAKYLQAVAWVALNDEPECLDVGEVSGFVSVALIADLFANGDTDAVARDVVKARRMEALNARKEG